MDVEKLIRETVHYEYYANDTNCATTTLICLGKLFGFEPEEQLISAAAGMHGAGGYRAQCGMVEGGLMSIGIIGKMRNIPKERIVTLCYMYAEAFEKEFGSLSCRDLRPNGFRDDDPPHLCENITVRACIFSYYYIKNNIKKSVGTVLVDLKIQEEK